MENFLVRRVTNGPSGLIDPARLAAAAGLDLRDLALVIGVCLSEMEGDPDCPAVQGGLSDILRILVAACGFESDPCGETLLKEAARWFNEVPIPGLGDLTARHLAQAGRAEAVQYHLVCLGHGDYA